MPGTVSNIWKWNFHKYMYNCNDTLTKKDSGKLSLILISLLILLKYFTMLKPVWHLSWVCLDDYHLNTDCKKVPYPPHLLFLLFYASVSPNYTQNNPVGLNDRLDRSQLIMNWENELGIIKLAFGIVRAKQTGANIKTLQRKIIWIIHVKILPGNFKEANIYFITQIACHQPGYL